MKIQLLRPASRVRSGFPGPPAPGADLLVLAGDIGSYQDRSRLMETDFGLGRFLPPGLARAGGLRARQPRVRQPRLRRDARSPARAVPRTGHPLAGTRNAGDAGRAAGRHHAVDRLRRAGATRRRTGLGAEEARQGVPRRRLLAKAGMRRHGEPFMAEQMREQGIACQQWLDEALRQPFDGVTLVITHFAPRWPAPIRATASRPAPPASAMRWTRCCRAPTTGCTATCIARWTI